jgi:hypothetical protein
VKIGKTGVVKGRRLLGALAQVTDRKIFAAVGVGLQIAIEHFWRNAETQLGRQRYNQSNIVK